MITTGNLLKLKDIVANQKLPMDNHDHHVFLSPKRMPKALESLKFNLLVTHFVSESNTKRRGPKQLEDFRWHWEVILMALSQAVFQRQWVVVALDSNQYGPNGDPRIKDFGFQLTHTRDIVRYLDEAGLVHFRVGKKYKDEPSRSRLFPTDDLVAQIWEFFFDIEQDIKPPYIAINDPMDKWGRVISRVVKDHPDKESMSLINRFLKGHRWACKGPVRLVYKHDAFQGGRLQTAFQNLPDRSCRVRINTLIDDEPICEVDFNANHLRLNLAVLHSQSAGDTPYEDIAELSCSDRTRVKRFITVAMGSSDEHEAFRALNREGFNAQLFETIKLAAIKRFPKVSLFEGWGLSAQNLEGAILRKVMLEGVQKGIVALPVHDAIAVKQCDAVWAKEAMYRVWEEETLGGTTLLKVDYPD